MLEVGPLTRQQRAVDRLAQREFAKALGNRMHRLGLTRIRVAIQMGVDPAQLSRWMTGAQRWSGGPNDFRLTVAAAIDELEAERAGAHA